jgi:hypothetical protein
MATAAKLDETILNEGEVVYTETQADERQAWRVVAGQIVGEYALQYQFKGKCAQAANGAVVETDGSVWRYFTGNDDMSHRRYFQGFRNAKAACKRHYARNN